MTELIYLKSFAILKGTKMCTGRRFSEIQLYLAVIKLILNYELIAKTNEDIKLSHSFILVPENSIDIVLKPRD